jgi:hypothetical protein
MFSFGSGMLQYLVQDKIEVVTIRQPEEAIDCEDFKTFIMCSDLRSGG